MIAGAPALPLGVDPLIAEAKQRARRRRLLVAPALLIAAAAVATTFVVDSGSAFTGMCASVPSGWHERSIPKTSLTPATVVLTNFRFGRMDDLFGFSDPHLGWPANGVTVAVSNDGKVKTPSLTRPLRVARADFGPFEGVAAPFATVTTSSQGRILDAYVKVGVLTPATIAAANEALAGVHACST